MTNAPAQTPAGVSPSAMSSAAPMAPGSTATFVGSKVCATCHGRQTQTFRTTKMGQLFLDNPHHENQQAGCETCHGPGSAHVARPRRDDGGPNSIMAFRADSPRPVRTRNAVCLTCHEEGERTHWQGSAHQNRDLACTDCHRVMDKVSPVAQLSKPTEIQVCTTCHADRRAQMFRSSHMPLREGAMTCSTCHQPHGTPNMSLLRTATPNETCFTCHADKRGPFLFEHPPVRENCMTCHDPHGSINANLLTVASPRLCQQCHSEATHPSMPQDPLSIYAFNRGCQNCHGQVHGSNSPSGARLHR